MSKAPTSADSTLRIGGMPLYKGSTTNAQLSRQLVDSLFGETASDFGVLELEGNTIEYRVEDDKVTLIITDEEGNTTEITVPLGSFTF